MADVTGLKNRHNTLGNPPPLEEASQNLTAPETAPVAVVSAPMQRRRKKKTTKTVQIGIRATPEVDRLFWNLYTSNDLSAGDMLEKLIMFYMQHH